MHQDLLESIRDYFRHDRFAAANGIEVVELRPGYARTRMTVRPEHLNSVALAHGGAIFSLAAVAFMAAGCSAGKTVVGINMSLAFVKACREGTLVAEAKEIARSRRLSTCTVRIVDESAALIAQLQGTGYLKDEPFPPSYPLP